MTNERDPCAAAREIVQESLDGPVAAEDARRMNEHLASCEACRDYREELGTIRSALRGLAEVPLPDDALEQVWGRTVRAPEAIRPTWGWRAAAAIAATVLLGALLVVWGPGLPEGERADVEPYSSAEVERARAEVRQVLELTVWALHRSGRAAVEDVLAGQISPALQRIPIDFPENKTNRADRRSKS